MHPSNNFEQTEERKFLFIYNSFCLSVLYSKIQKIVHEQRLPVFSMHKIVNYIHVKSKKSNTSCFDQNFYIYWDFFKLFWPFSFSFNDLHISQLLNFLWMFTYLVFSRGIEGVRNHMIIQIRSVRSSTASIFTALNLNFRGHPPLLSGNII